MATKNVDIVFVIDASGSMSPCIQAVLSNIGKVVDDLQQMSFRTRLGAVIHNVVARDKVRLASFYTQLNGGHMLDALSRGAQMPLFTADDEEFRRSLGTISAAGDEDMLMALDCALDFPFGSPSDTQRAVVLLSDEPFEGNYRFAEHGAEYAQKALRMVKKINDRHILLFTVMPDCEISDILAASARAFKIVVSDEMQGTGLASFDFTRFFSNLGQTISATWRQMRLDKPYEKALFGQDRYVPFGDLEDMEGM